MSIPCKFERSILSYDEREIILRSHHSEIYDASLDELRALRQRCARCAIRSIPWRAKIAVRCAEKGRNF
jgi:hypothetical protein